MINFDSLLKDGKKITLIKERKLKAEREQYRSAWDALRKAVLRDFGNLAPKLIEMPDDFSGQREWIVNIYPFNRRFSGDNASFVLSVPYIVTGVTWKIGSIFKSSYSYTTIGAFACAINPSVEQPRTYKCDESFSTLAEAYYWLHLRWKPR